MCRACLLLSALALAITACGGSPGTDDLPTAVPTEPPTSASATVEPTLSISTPPSTVTLPGAQGLALVGTYTAAGRAPSPAVLLLHMYGDDRTSWEALAGELAAAGIASLAIDLRGHGETDGAEDWDLAQQDVAAAFEWLRRAPDVDPARVGVVGASIGANLALVQAAHSGDVAAAALLSPGMDYFRVKIDGLAAQAENVPLFLAASEDDGYSAQTVRILAEEATGKHELSVFEGSAHGTDMLAQRPQLAGELTQFLVNAFEG